MHVLLHATEIRHVHVDACHSTLSVTMGMTDIINIKFFMESLLLRARLTGSPRNLGVAAPFYGAS